MPCMYFLSYIQGMCTRRTCYEKAKVKTTDEQGNPTSYFVRYQKHVDYDEARYKDSIARVSYRFYMYIVLVII